MPVIASATLSQKVEGFEDGRLEIVNTEIKNCGCLEIEDLSEKLSIPVKELTPIIEALVDSGKITCSKDSGVCCKDATKLEEFTKKLTKIRSQTRS